MHSRLAWSCPPKIKGARGLATNPIGIERTKAIATVLQSEHCHLTHLLTPDPNSIRTEGADAIAAAPQSERCQLTHLDLYVMEDDRSEKHKVKSGGCGGSS